MKHMLLAGLLFIFAGCSSSSAVDARVSTISGSEDEASPLQQKQWLHGSADCLLNKQQPIDIFRFDQSSYILRQNKCLNFEAPFIYLLIGTEKALVLDTGATESADEFPLYETVRTLIKQQAGQAGTIEKEILVIHSHSHSDHYAGDPQFAGKPNVTLVEPNSRAMMHFFDFNDWPVSVVNIELGQRKLTIIPTPGHQEEAITIFDAQTKWLLTGDTFYPGFIYVKNWQDYQHSVARLVEFTQSHEVSYVLGAHIEMTAADGVYYPIGTMYQPNEADLALTPEHLLALDLELKKLDEPEQIIFNDFIVTPMNIFQKTLSNIARWIFQ
ncbi:MBL fold metallo-hydrolase [Thalassotalea sp. 42_200_T64]|nr:MBL fold metallo-hydrolase [Thalassotalea sp. 42_200_T64]